MKCERLWSPGLPDREQLEIAAHSQQHRAILRQLAGYVALIPCQYLYLPTVSFEIVTYDTTP